MRLVITLAAALMCVSAYLLAHGAGGCTCHKSPTASAPHGGEMEETAQNQYVEVVADEEEITVYVMDEALRPLPAGNVIVEGSAVMPRDSKPQVLNFQAKGGRFVSRVKIDSRAHRYTIKLQVQTPAGRDKLEFQVEL